MKKFFALLLVLVMLVPFVVACGGGEETTTTTTEKTNTDGNFSSKTTVKRDWADQTLLVAATAWGGSPGYPWSTMEIVIKEGQTSGWGEKIDAAVLDRTAAIYDKYGVKVVWEWASRYDTHKVLKNAILAGNDPDYDLAMPRQFRIQTIVADNSVYDMANRQYIDFDNPYFNDLSVKTYTAKGHTFFITGDFANLDKETAFVLYFNKDVLGDEAATNKLYQMVRDGKWTFDQLVSLSNSRYKDDGDGKFNDSDTYGLSTTSLTRFYEYFGVTQAGVDESTGEWKIALKDPKVDDIVAKIITANTANWARSAWGGAWGSDAQQALKDDRLLFYNEVIQHIAHVAHFGNIGIVPFPMLNEEQGRYYAPCAGQQPTLMCVPRTTSDRNMSDYFVDVLAWTGRDYVMDAYYENMADQVDSAVEMEMIKEYIMPNVSYDAGAATPDWGSLMGSVLSASYNGNVNNFAQAYANAEAGALKKIQSWNDAWGAYEE